MQWHTDLPQTLSTVWSYDYEYTVSEIGFVFRQRTRWERTHLFSLAH